jgi:hypothetical protein
MNSLIFKVINMVGEQNSLIFDMEKITKINFFEKIGLYFCKRRYFTDKEGIHSTTLVYKRMFKKVYILKHYHNPPQHWNCRCMISEFHKV